MATESMKLDLPLTTYHLPLIVIVGPTASGKTGAAIEIAKRFNGEVICADSRTIYKGMDIATAKPTKVEQQGIIHWGLDLISPDAVFSAADFKRYATKKIEEIRHREHMPILVGGTGLYIDSVLFDFTFGSAADQSLREVLESMSLEELYQYCITNNVMLPENSKNKRYVIRAIETTGQTKKQRITPLENTIVVGITTNKLVLRQKIENRIDLMLKQGVIQETQHLGALFGWQSQAMTSNIYPIVHAYLDEEITLAEVREKAILLDWKLAKRQLTWLKRNSFIHWMPVEQISSFVADSLANISEA